MARKKKKGSYFTLLAAVMGVLAAAAGVWLASSFLTWRSLEDDIARISKDRERALDLLQKHPDLVAKNAEAAAYPFDHVAFLQDFMNECSKSAKVGWAGPPQHAKREGGALWEANAGFRDLTGDALVSLAHLLDSGRAKTSVFKFTATRTGPNADKAGTATWQGEFWIKAPVKEAAAADKAKKSR